MIYNAMDNKLHIFKKRRSAVASYSKNNNFFWQEANAKRCGRQNNVIIITRVAAHNADQQRVCRHKTVAFNL